MFLKDIKIYIYKTSVLLLNKWYFVSLINLRKESLIKFFKILKLNF